MRGRRLLAWEAGLVAVALGLQSVHRVTSYDAGFMYVDLVGVPAVFASLLLGMRSGVRVAAVTALGIAALDSSGLVGALLKLAATVSTMVALRVATPRVAVVLAGVAGFLVLGGTSLTLRLLGSASLYLGIAAVSVPLLVAIAVAVAEAKERGPSVSRAVPFRHFLVPLLAAVTFRGTLMIFGDLFFAVPVFFHATAVEAMQAYPPATILWWNGVQAVIDGVAAWTAASAFETSPARLV